MTGLTRRAVLAAAVPLAAACSSKERTWTGGWVGGAAALGHRLRDGRGAEGLGAPVARRADVLVVGGGVAGLSCARELAAAGVDDVHVLDLEPQAGGNSRGHRLGGFACPLGAHYLPTPPDHAHDLLALLESFGVCRQRFGRWEFDERHLCHSPQERLFYQGHWHDGLLPVPDDDPSALAAYRAFSAAVADVRRRVRFALPTAQAPWTPTHAALDGVTMAAWLDAGGHRHPLLRGYLDYCCRDDFGAGLGQVSAWAGLHYFASRHGFQAPGEGDGERDAVLTWPEGNGWLTARLAAPLASRLHTDRLVLRVDEGRDDVQVLAVPATGGPPERWTARHVVLATPLHVATRLLPAPPAALVDAAATVPHAPWLVANLLVDDALDDPPGAPPAWDNVLHGSAMLGYVDAMHQSTRPHPGPTVLTAYWALGGDDAATLRAMRRKLLDDDWRTWAAAVVADLAVAHPDLPAKVAQVDLMRYGHAMAVPVPGVRGSAALVALARPHGRVSFAHSDLSGYSVFEEAFAHGQRAARDLLSRASAPRSRPSPPARRG